MTTPKQIKQRWTTALKSGVNATVIVRDAIAHCQEHGDTSLLSTMIYAADKAGMQPYGKRLRVIVKAIYPDATIRKTKDGAYAITRGDRVSDQHILALQGCVDDQLSLIGPKIGEVFGVQKDEKPLSEQVEARAKSAAKFLANNGDLSVEAYIKMVREEYAKAKAMKLANAA